MVYEKMVRCPLIFDKAFFLSGGVVGMCVCVRGRGRMIFRAGQFQEVTSATREATFNFRAPGDA